MSYHTSDDEVSDRSNHLHHASYGRVWYFLFYFQYCV